ncbi:hypothetical protein LTR36_009598 [Oleoguttula mirabilis]|uniref:Uncharacterized protein n=1 Tax=Oleoguttula mirabilis TaxID=1507867 RepID=A0AAV9J600_9PEZI|nr:hypothetical protein LTR36_009598 [Oleoguttula mirabilis]
MATLRRTLPRPVHLILDWDGTLTKKDTLSILGNLPKARDARLGIPHTPSHHWNDDFLKPYMDDYGRHKQSSSLYPTAADPEKYSQWLASLRTVEYNSAERVSDSGFFCGVNEIDVTTVAHEALDAGEMQLRNGWLDLFNMFLPAASPPLGSRISILSVNWSATFIRSSLRQAAARYLQDGDGRQQLMVYVGGMEIQANEIEGLGSVERGSSGRLVGTVRTAADKLQHRPIVRKPGHASERPIDVYVGDSATDYECLRHATIGIWLCDCAETEYEQKLKETFKPLELEIRPIDQFRSHADSGLCWASDLGQVAKLLERLQHWREQ